MDSKESLKLYYESIKEQFPDLSQSDIEQMCRAPFTFTRKVIARGQLASVRLQYLGVFKVNYRRAVSSLKNLDKSYQSTNMDKEQYETIKASLQEYVKNSKYYEETEDKPE